MVLNQNTYVKLVHVEITPEHQLTFNSLQEQIAYFEGIEGLVLTGFTYQRKDNIIRYPLQYDEVEKYNYVIYRNDYNDQTRKYYFAYITDISYTNNDVSEIKIQTDVFQTWQFDFIYKKSFIERKHVTDDIAGNYTMLEPVATGEYIVNDYDYYDDMDEYYYAIQVTELIPPYDTAPIPITDCTNFGGVPLAGWCFMVDSISDFSHIIEQYNLAQKTSAIYNAYMIPKICVEPGSIVDLVVYKGQDFPCNYLYSVTKPTDLGGYIPKNQKLFTYPYCYLLISNNNGSNNILNYEKFKTEDCNFQIAGIPTPSGSIKCTPSNYAYNNASVQEEGILAGKYPTLNWNENVYADWLLTNSASLNTQASFGGVATAGGLLSTLTGLGLMFTGVATLPGIGMTLAGLGSMTAGLHQIQNAMATDIDHSKIPMSSSGLASGGDINVTGDRAGFFFYKYSIKREFAEMIDNYFSMYGYKVNTMEVPNLHTRVNWNYLKVLDPNVEGNEIPEKDILIYKQMLTNGVTFWHNPNTFRDYSQNNGNS